MLWMAWQSISMAWRFSTRTLAPSSSKMEKNSVTSLIWGMFSMAADAVYQQCGGDDGYGGVLRAADGHLAEKAASAADHVFSQGSSLFSSHRCWCALLIACPIGLRFIRRNPSSTSIP